MSDHQSDAANAASSHESIEERRSTRSQRSTSSSPSIDAGRNEHNPESSTVSSNESAREQPGSEERPGESNIVDIPQASTSYNSGSSAEVSSSRVRGLGALGETIPVQSRVAPVFESRQVPGGERTRIPDNQQEPWIGYQDSGNDGDGGGSVSDLVTSSRPRNEPNSTLPPPPATPPPPEVVLPRWQPDAEVTLCPICGTQFSFFIRKHHCRKCGRVVCSACSPHRITIPHQFIVQPPTEPTPPRGGPSRQYPPLQSSPASTVGSLGGGERVRLCNPCVPDPNIAPPQSPRHVGRFAPSPLSRSHNRSSSLASSSSALFGRQETGEEAQARRQGALQPASARYGYQAQYAHPMLSQQHTQNQERRSTVSSTVQDFDSLLRANLATANLYRDAHANSWLNHGEATSYPSNQSTAGRPPSIVGARPRLHQRPDNYGIYGPGRGFYNPPQNPTLHPYADPRQHDDADFCPVCHHRLPSRSEGQAGVEALREAHINECIEAAMRGSSSSPPVPTTPQRSTPSSSLPSSSLHPSTAGSIPAPASSQTQAQAIGRSPSGLPRRTGIFPYKATEKDCVDSAECTICFEEFEVTVDMGRLECFCRFHYHCIMRWFQSHPGQCPVHQHDNNDY